MVESVGLIIPDDYLSLIESGKLIRTDGILRNAKDMTIFEHLKTVSLEEHTTYKWEIKESLKEYISENRLTVFLLIICIISAVFGMASLVAYKRKKERGIEEKYNAWLNATLHDYFIAASENRLDVEIIQACEDALKSLPRITNKVFLSLTKVQIAEFSNNLRVYTEKLAEDHDYTISEVFDWGETEKIVSIMLKNMEIQKAILKDAA